MLSLFVNLFANVMTTTDDDDFMHGSPQGSLFPLTVEESTRMAKQFRYLLVSNKHIF